eukprot:1745636-Pleurochrysis_carterae.AAC.4
MYDKNKRGLEATQTSKRDVYAEMRAEKKASKQGRRKSPSRRPLKHQGEASTPRCGPRPKGDNAAHDDKNK